MFKIFPICLLLSWSIIGQNSDSVLQVDYLYKIDNGGSGIVYEAISRLTIAENKSLFEIDHLKSFYSQDPVSEDDSQIVYSIPSKENDFVFSDQNTLTVHYADRIEFEPIYITSKLDTLMTWSYEANTKEILGYSCKQAVAEYGGRYYIAYYTTELPFKGGPYRFLNLPGLILEVYSTDNFLTLKAQQVTIFDDPETQIIDPYGDKTFILWNQFLKQYRIEFDRVLNDNMREWGPSQVLAKKRIVEYIKDPKN